MKPKLTPCLLFLIYFLFLFSCKTEKNLDEFQFLVGQWEGDQQLEKPFFEPSFAIYSSITWKKEDNSFLLGERVAHSGPDTFFHEKIKLEIRDGEIFYITTLPNNKETVSFKMVSFKNSHWTFENKEHDFPQEIIYHFVQPDSLYITLHGNDRGNPFKTEFYFKKLN
ncbi:MAG: hypothetical protein EPN85_11760 [Bacteroidetes bacterium]|nr:MAG: hypothetical protein EPN85_11760 [Bacteroidota bacterium]